MVDNHACASEAGVLVFNLNYVLRYTVEYFTCATVGNIMVKGARASMINEILPAISCR